jgi:hypothetical protein
MFFFPLRLPEWSWFFDRQLRIAACRLAWLLSRKYGTAWYHPVSSKLWYLTVLPFVNFQEKN